MFFIGVLPALLVIYVWKAVPESEVWLEGKQQKLAEVSIWASFRNSRALYIYAIVLMAAFNFMSHGSQDLYPTFLQKQREFGVGTVTLLAIIANVGAIVGGIFFGALSQHFGRRNSIALAACIGILTIPLWVFAPNVALLAVGAFTLQIFVQGAWGVIPVHLNELSPAEARGTFPGFTYQLGNLDFGGCRADGGRLRRELQDAQRRRELRGCARDHHAHRLPRGRRSWRGSATNGIPSSSRLGTTAQESLVRREAREASVPNCGRAGRRPSTRPGRADLDAGSAPILDGLGCGTVEPVQPPQLRKHHPAHRDHRQGRGAAGHDRGHQADQCRQGPRFEFAQFVRGADEDVLDGVDPAAHRVGRR